MANFDTDFNNFYMKLALGEAHLAYLEGEVPVGRVGRCERVHQVLGTMMCAHLN